MTDIVARPVRRGGSARRSGCPRPPRSALRGVVGCLAIVSALACDAPPPVPGEWVEGEGFRWRTLDVRRAATNAAEARAGFTPLDAERTGVTHRNDVDDARAMANP